MEAVADVVESVVCVVGHRDECGSYGAIRIQRRRLAHHYVRHIGDHEGDADCEYRVGWADERRCRTAHVQGAGCR